MTLYVYNLLGDKTHLPSAHGFPSLQVSGPPRLNKSAFDESSEFLIYCDDRPMMGSGGLTAGFC